MSDQSISIVPKQSAFPNKESKAKEILQWLVSLDIVQSILSECTLSSSQGYAISSGAKNVVTEPEYLPFALGVNGLEIIAERQVFHTGQNGIEELICPSCRQDIANEDWDLLSEWGDNISNNLSCPLCSVPTEIQQFKFTPAWGFSDLGFTFCNWPPFTAEFIHEFSQKLDCDVNVVHTWV